MRRWRRPSAAPVAVLLVTALCAGVLVVILVTKQTGPAPPAAHRHTTAKPPAKAPHGPPRSETIPFSAGNPWSTAIPSTAKPASDSAAIVSNLVQQIRTNDGHVALNTNQYTATLYTVGPGQPKVNISFDNCQHRSSVQAGMAKALAGVPLPDGAVGSVGTDSEISIYQPATKHLWEFWKFQHAPNGHASACWGGEINDVSHNPGAFPYPYGATASGLPLAGFLIRAREVASRQIDHTLGIDVISARKGVTSWPANRTDGNGGGDAATDPVEGERFRLNPKLDLAKLQLNPLALAVARAIQRYGMIVTDQSQGALAIQAQDLRSYGSGGQDPDPYASAAGKMPADAWLAGIPWNQLQAMPLNYGKAASP